MSSLTWQAESFSDRLTSCRSAASGACLVLESARHIDAARRLVRRPTFRLPRRTDGFHGGPKGRDELGDRRPVSVVSHPVGESDEAGTVDDEVTAELEHVWSEAEETFSGQQEPQGTPVQRRREHSPEEICAPQTPLRIGRAGTIEGEREGKTEIMEHLRLQQTGLIVGDEENTRRDVGEFVLSFQHLDQVRPGKRSGSVA